MSELDKNQRRRLERNLVKYAWSKPLGMRVYFPILGVYLVSIGQLSLPEISVTTIIAGLLSVILQMPAGYFADKYDNERALKLGTLLSLTSPLWYVICPNFWGAVVGLCLFMTGHVFIGNGTSESLMHDTMVKLGRAKEYSKLMGRAQSLGLLGNVVLVALVPLTYPLWWPLPFLIGFVAQIALFLLVRSYEFPDLPRVHALKTPMKALKSVVNLGNIALFLFFGFVASLGWPSGAGEYLQLRLEDVGLLAGGVGIVQAGGSLVGAGLGLIIHIFDRVRPKAFYLFDLLVVVGCLAIIGLTPNLAVAITVTVIFMGWLRVRTIVFHAKLLSEIKHVYKATLLSALSFFTNIGQMVVPALLAWSVLRRNGSLGGGYVLFAGLALAIGLFLWVLILLTVRHRINGSSETTQSFISTE